MSFTVMRNLIKPFYILIACIALMIGGQPAFGQQNNNSYPPMTGFVDMHAHPRGDLAYGTELFYGAPYGDISVVLKNCKHDHGSNILRQQLAIQTEKQNNPDWNDGHVGYPDFATWPSWCSILHQQMWVDWIERAHKGGLNVMVALAEAATA